MRLHSPSSRWHQPSPSSRCHHPSPSPLSLFLLTVAPTEKGSDDNDGKKVTARPRVLWNLTVKITKPGNILLAKPCMFANPWMPYIGFTYFWSHNYSSEVAILQLRAAFVNTLIQSCPSALLTFGLQVPCFCFFKSQQATAKN